MVIPYTVDKTTQCRDWMTGAVYGCDEVQHIEWLHLKFTHMSAWSITVTPPLVSTIPLQVLYPQAVLLTCLMQSAGQKRYRK
jgi:hypothetical protein